MKILIVIFLFTGIILIIMGITELRNNMSCPTECQNKHNENREDIKNLFKLSINPTMRGLFIKSIITLFVLYGVLWAYTTDTFATKAELNKVRDDIRSDIKSGFQIQRTDFKNFISELKKAK